MYPMGFSSKNHKTYWCPQCNRFSLAPAKSESIQLCPVHKVPMVDSPDDPQRTEQNAPFDVASRHPIRKRGMSQYEIDELILKTESLETALSELPADAPIAVISNTEDEDIKYYVINALLARGRKKIWISEPDPRYQWVDKLDPNWRSKFGKALTDCTVAIYIRRPGARPNKATAWELETLREIGKNIIIYEANIRL